MANLTLSATNNAGTVTHTTANYSEAAFTRFTDWAWDAYPQYVTPGDPSSGLKPKNAANVAAAVTDAFKAVVEGIKANVVNHEKVTAAKTASDGVAAFPSG